MKNITFLFVALFFAWTSTSAQLYKTNIGVRLDESQFGISLDQKIFRQLTAQMAFDAWSNEVRATALVRYHLKLIGKRLNMYPGIGMHSGMYKEQGSYSGLTMLVGAEYKMMILPVVLSFDVSPAFHTHGHHPDWWNFQTVFSIKYVLIRDRPKMFDGEGDGLWK